MPPKQIFCGTKPLKKNQKRGTMIECAQANQVRFWGLYQIDKRLLDYIEKNKSQSIDKIYNNLISQLITLRGKRNRLVKEQKKENEPEIDKIKEEIRLKLIEVKKIENDRDNMKDGSKRTSKNIDKVIDKSISNKKIDIKMKNDINNIKKEKIIGFDKILNELENTIDKDIKEEEQLKKKYYLLKVSLNNLLKLDPPDKKTIDNNIIKETRQLQRKQKVTQSNINNKITKLKQQKNNAKYNISNAQLKKVDTLIKNLEKYSIQDRKFDNAVSILFNDIVNENKRITKTITLPKTSKTSKSSKTTKAPTSSGSNDAVALVKDIDKKLSKLMDKEGISVNSFSEVKDPMDYEEDERDRYENMHEFEIYGETNRYLSEDEYNYWKDVAYHLDGLYELKSAKSKADKDKFMKNYFKDNRGLKELKELITAPLGLKYNLNSLHRGKYPQKYETIVNSLQNDINQLSNLKR